MWLQVFVPSNNTPDMTWLINWCESSDSWMAKLCFICWSKKLKPRDLMWNQFDTPVIWSLVMCFQNFMWVLGWPIETQEECFRLSFCSVLFFQAIWGLLWNRAAWADWVTLSTHHTCNSLRRHSPVFGRLAASNRCQFLSFSSMDAPDFSVGCCSLLWLVLFASKILFTCFHNICVGLDSRGSA